MAEIGGETSSSLSKPLIVRVKRKSSQSPLQALWLEINERPLKRPLVDFDKLSITSDSSKTEILKSKKVFVQHVETVSSAMDHLFKSLQQLFRPHNPNSCRLLLSIILIKGRVQEFNREMEFDSKPLTL